MSEDYLRQQQWAGVVLTLPIKVAGKVLLHGLIFYSDPAGNCSVDLPRLASESGLSNRRARAALKNLAGLGYVEIYPGHYRLTLPGAVRLIGGRL